MQIIIFSPLLTPRIKYIFNFILSAILKAEVEFTVNSTYFSQSEKVRVSYADKPLSDELFFKNTALLLSNKVEELKLKTVPFGDYHVPFPVDGSLLPFDVFAASFFILSRYEEYLHKNKSEDIFTPKDSLQYKWKILERPIIDEWALLLKNMIRKKYPSFKFQEKTFHHQSTINFTLKPDVPSGFFPKTKFIFSSVFDKRQQFLSSVFDEFTGIAVNHERTINELSETNPKNQPVYFINFPQDDKNRLNFKNSALFLKEKQIGLLRPYTINKEQSTMLKADLLKLGKIQDSAIDIRTQQLELLKLPTCYLHLLSAGIISDYSMGYSDKVGFRAGTCTPFNWYDLQLNKVTPIEVKSYSISDTAIHYQPVDDAIKTIKDIIDAVKLVDGYFYSSWKLKNLSENSKFKKWKAVFNEMIKYAG
ncbi:hypothetical protein [Pedobacter sp. Leaf176]|uniref:DUF7033 domain-containing protein n=1 Tax=Pedobacter sp. Leaf176 TaxID=1736286 RepID=UPI0006F8C62E|nr:hypothetical protein [Pedobacter sp. Leaf176]KQR72078.1 hypothetical protein ASF92_01880 [Pedobacter sp. Leaf176]